MWNTHSSVFQEHFFESQKVCKCEKQVKYITWHFIFVLSTEKKKLGNEKIVWGKFVIFEIVQGQKGQEEWHQYLNKNIIAGYHRAKLQPNITKQYFQSNSIVKFI